MGLLNYGAMAAKIRAMESRLFTDEDYIRIASLETVPEFANYLQNSKGYNDVFFDVDIESLHRGHLEKLLSKDKYNDFAKIYRFANIKQRRFLDLYFMRYEITLIKSCHRMLFDNQPVRFNLDEFRDFFDRHSDVDLSKLLLVTTIDEMHEALKDTKYYAPLAKLRGLSAPTLFDYETQLDLFYFTAIWKNKAKCLSGTDLQIITDVYGTRIDMVNIQWIYRTKKYHKLPPARIYTYILPFCYKLKPAQLAAMVEAPSLEDFNSVYKSTYYKNYDYNERVSLEDIHRQLQLKLARTSVKQHPYSIAAISSYLYKKDTEVRRLVSALECIRYKLPPADSLAYIMK